MASLPVRARGRYGCAQMLQTAIVNMKGGVGKTTTAIHLAAGLARQGARVLLVDTDPQGNIGHALGVPRQRTLCELMRGEASIGDVVSRGTRERLDVIPSTPAAFALESQLAGTPARETVLARRLGSLDGYDAVIVDTSPAMSLLTYNALLYASSVIIPVDMDGMAVLGARQTLAGIRQIRELWPDRRLDLLAVLPMQVNASTNATRATFEALAEDAEMRERVYRRGIRQCIDVTYALTQRQTIWEYAPRSRAAEDFDAFVRFVGGAADAEQRPGRADTAIEGETVV